MTYMKKNDYKIWSLTEEEEPETGKVLLGPRKQIPRKSNSDGPKQKTEKLKERENTMSKREPIKNATGMEINKKRDSFLTEINRNIITGGEHYNLHIENTKTKPLIDSNQTAKSYDRSSKLLNPPNKILSKEITLEIPQSKGNLEEVKHNIVNLNCKPTSQKHKSSPSKDVKITYKRLKEDNPFSKTFFKKIQNLKSVQNLKGSNNSLSHSNNKTASPEKHKCNGSIQSNEFPNTTRFKSINKMEDKYTKHSKVKKREGEKMEIGFSPQLEKLKIPLREKVENFSKASKENDKSIQNPKDDRPSNGEQITRSDQHFALSGNNKILFENYKKRLKETQKTFSNNFAKNLPSEIWKLIKTGDYDFEDVITQSFNRRFTTHITFLNESEIALNDILDSLIEKDPKSSLSPYGSKEIQDLKNELETCSNENNSQILRSLDDLYESETANFKSICDEMRKLSDKIASLSTYNI